MSIAARVKEIILTQCPGAFGLYGGYGINGGGPVFFPRGVLMREKRNHDGRCTLAEYKYADDSILTYRYNTKTEHYVLDVKEPK